MACMWFFTLPSSNFWGSLSVLCLYLSFPSICSQSEAAITGHLQTFELVYYTPHCHKFYHQDRLLIHVWTRHRFPEKSRATTYKRSLDASFLSPTVKIYILLSLVMMSVKVHRKRKKNPMDLLIWSVSQGRGIFCSISPFLLGWLNAAKISSVVVYLHVCC